MSVHEEGANVRRSIQAETAEASSLLPFSTNLSDKERWERQLPRPGCYGIPKPAKALVVTHLNATAKRTSAYGVCVCFFYTLGGAGFQSKKRPDIVDVNCRVLMRSRHTLFTQTSYTKVCLSQSPTVAAVIWNSNWYFGGLPSLVGAFLLTKTVW